MLLHAVLALFTAATEMQRADPAHARFLRPPQAYLHVLVRRHGLLHGCTISHGNAHSQSSSTTAPFEAPVNHTPFCAATRR